MVDNDVQKEIDELGQRWTDRAGAGPAVVLTPAWWQNHVLSWATSDPEFRVKLLRFVDVLPTLRDAAAIADHVRQYFRGSHRAPVQLATGLAAQYPFRPALSRVVRQGVFTMAHRFIAGASAEEARPLLHELAQDGIGSTIDLLGESTLSNAEADVYLGRYRDLLETLSRDVVDLAPRGPEWHGVPAVNVSVKLSSLSPHLPPAAPEYVSDALRARLRPILALAKERNAHVQVDMEQFHRKELVHRTFADAVLEPEFADYPHVGIAVQAYLRDALDDIARLRGLAQKRGAPITIRLVKGAYWDEERILARQNSWSVPVFERKEDTDTSFEACVDALIDAWPHLLPALGTHNPHSAAYAAVAAKQRGLEPADVEFQLLHGMTEGLRAAIAEEGYRTRAYVPVGQLIPGMAYLVRRLLENTSNQAWFVGPFGSPTNQAASGGVLQSGIDEDRADTFRNVGPTPFFDQDARRRMATAIENVRRSFGDTYPLLIGGRRVLGRPTSDICYPAEPDTIVGSVAEGTAEDVDRAVSVARSAFPSWRDLPASERAEKLLRAADIIEERRYELAAIEIFESAKPWEEADADVAEAIDFLRYYAEQAQGLHKPQGRGRVPGEKSEYFYEGRGVAAVIAPWNFPLAIITGMSSAALAAGNCVILKPSGLSPIIAFRLTEIYHAAGIPPEVALYLPGTSETVGQALVEHTDVDTIAFTGSNTVGLKIIEAAGRTQPGQRNVKRVIAEMGGKNAIIVDEDADLDEAVSGILTSAFGYAGQKCSAASRLFVVGRAYDETIERLRHGVASLKVGPPHEPETLVGPVISPAAREKILRYIEDARRSSNLLVHTSVPKGSGHYVPPTVFTEVPEDAPVACEEIFGPVLAVFRAATFGDAVRSALASPYALTGGIFSRNPRNIEMARREFRVGNLYVNRKTTGAIVGRQPFGGLRMSGVGEKAGGPDYLRQFAQPRVITENTLRRGFAPE